MRSARVLTVVWVVLALTAFGWPAAGLPRVGVTGASLLAHVLIFLVGTVVALRGWPANRVAVILLLLVFAPLTEVWQAVLPTGRSPELIDVAANVVGIGTGWLLSAGSTAIASRGRKGGLNPKLRKV